MQFAKQLKSYYIYFLSFSAECSVLPSDSEEHKGMDIAHCNSSTFAYGCEIFLLH
jgi:hypothetical protein